MYLVGFSCYFFFDIPGRDNQGKFYFIPAREKVSAAGENPGLKNTKYNTQTDHLIPLLDEPKALLICKNVFL